MSRADKKETGSFQEDLGILHILFCLSLVVFETALPIVPSRCQSSSAGKWRGAIKRQSEQVIVMDPSIFAGTDICGTVSTAGILPTAVRVPTLKG